MIHTDTDTDTDTAHTDTDTDTGIGIGMIPIPIPGIGGTIHATLIFTEEITIFTFKDSLFTHVIF